MKSQWDVKKVSSQYVCSHSSRGIIVACIRHRSHQTPINNNLSVRHIKLEIQKSYKEKLTMPIYCICHVSAVLARPTSLILNKNCVWFLGWKVIYTFCANNIESFCYFIMDLNYSNHQVSFNKCYLLITRKH